jgi:hypothetical protein
LKKRIGGISFAWYHPRHVGAGRGDRYARPEPSDCLQSESGQTQAAAIERERDDQIRLNIDNAEVPRHHAHDLAGARIDRDRAADD